MPVENMKVPFDISEPSFFKSINTLSEHTIIDDPSELFPLLHDLDEDKRAYILNPLFIVSANEKDKIIRFDRQEWTTMGFKPKLHHALFYFDRIPNKNVPEEIRRSALGLGSLILDSLFHNSGCVHASDEMLTFLWPVFLRFEQLIYANTKDKKPHKLNGTKSTFAWLTQAELNEQIVFERSSEITLGEAIKICFKYAAEKKGDAVYRFINGDPSREDIKEAIALFKADAEADLNLMVTVNPNKKTVKNYSLPHSIVELMNIFSVADTTLRTFIKGTNNQQSEYIIKEKRGKYIYKSSQKDRIKSLLRK